MYLYLYLYLYLFQVLLLRAWPRFCSVSAKCALRISVEGRLLWFSYKYELVEETLPDDLVIDRQGRGLLLIRSLCHFWTAPRLTLLAI